MSERVRVGELEIAYVDAGPRDAPVLLLVPGFTGHRDDFENVVPSLAESRRVIVPDLRGHGDSARASGIAEYTFDAAVADLLGLADALGVARADWLGHSMGGMLALRLALAAAERVHSLVLLCTAPEAPPFMREGGLERPIAIALEDGMEALQARAERRGRRDADPVLARWAEPYWAHHRRRYLAMDAAAYAGFGRAMVDQAPVTARLGEIACPTLVLVGDADVDFLPGADLLEKGIPGARRITLVDAGHHPHRESRDGFLDAMRAHLEAVDRGA